MKVKKLLMLLIFFFTFFIFSMNLFAASNFNLPNDFNTNGDSIKGWYWLRDNSLQNYAQWTFENIPSGNSDLVLDITALATDRPDGRRGLSAEFLFIYEVPGGNVFVTQKVTLPNVSSPSDSVGYTCNGQITIPRLVIQEASVLFVRVERISLNTNHVAFKKGSIEIVETIGAEAFPPYQETQFYQGNQLPDTNNQDDAFLIQSGVYTGSLGGQTAQSQIDKEDWYSLNLLEGQKITLQLAQPSGGNFTIYLKKPESSSGVGSTTRQDNIRTLQYVATASGIWYIRVRRSSGEGDYQLSVDIQNQNDAGSHQDAGNTFDEAIEITTGQFTGFLNISDKDDCYKIYLQEGQIINLRLIFPPDARFSPFLYRPNSNHSEGIVHTQDNTKTLQHTIEMTGFWLIRIRRSTGEGDYQLSINLSGAPSAQTGQSQSASVEKFTATSSNSNGNMIQGWYWLRDPEYQDYMEWTFNNIPPGHTDLILDITALATNRGNGGKGFSANFRLIYGFPGSGQMGGVFRTAEITLPNVSPSNDPVGYTCHGIINVPRDFVSGASTFFFRVERTSPNDNHIAFNSESITLYNKEPSTDFQEIQRSGTKK